MKTDKTKDSLDADLKLYLESSNSFFARLELLLIQIVRELKRIK